MIISGEMKAASKARLPPTDGKCGNGTKVEKPAERL